MSARCLLNVFRRLNWHWKGGGLSENKTKTVQKVVSVSELSSVSGRCLFWAENFLIGISMIEQEMGIAFDQQAPDVIGALEIYIETMEEVTSWLSAQQQILGARWSEQNLADLEPRIAQDSQVSDRCRRRALANSIGSSAFADKLGLDSQVNSQVNSQANALEKHQVYSSGQSLLERSLPGHMACESVGKNARQVLSASSARRRLAEAHKPSAPTLHQDVSHDCLKVQEIDGMRREAMTKVCRGSTEWLLSRLASPAIGLESDGTESGYVISRLFRALTLQATLMFATQGTEDAELYSAMSRYLVSGISPSCRVDSKRPSCRSAFVGHLSEEHIDDESLVPNVRPAERAHATGDVLEWNIFGIGALFRSDGPQRIMSPVFSYRKLGIRFKIGGEKDADHLAVSFTVSAEVILRFRIGIKGCKVGMTEGEHSFSLAPWTEEMKLPVHAESQNITVVLQVLRVATNPPESELLRVPDADIRARQVKHSNLDLASLSTRASAWCPTQQHAQPRGNSGLARQLFEMQVSREQMSNSGSNCATRHYLENPAQTSFGSQSLVHKDGNPTYSTGAGNNRRRGDARSPRDCDSPSTIFPRTDVVRADFEEPVASRSGSDRDRVDRQSEAAALERRSRLRSDQSTKLGQFFESNDSGDAGCKAKGSNRARLVSWESLSPSNRPSTFILGPAIFNESDDPLAADLAGMAYLAQDFIDSELGSIRENL